MAVWPDDLKGRVLEAEVSEEKVLEVLAGHVEPDEESKLDLRGGGGEFAA
jgi:hypothetical protein